jgi:eukaryotic-like serine/threonine-protein kinase
MSSVHTLTPVPPPAAPRTVGRYRLYEEISSGGMASVHFGRLSSDAGFSRTVAIKYLHPHHARDAGFIAMFLDEARLVSRIRHPNVATPLDVVVVPDSQEVSLVMEYIHGETLSRLIKGALALRLPMSQNICASILSGALNGLHAAHEAVDELGDPLNIVHRDISPQNIMVGEDGVARVLDFGIAKAVSRSQSTQEGHVKGKVAYMSPEQLTERAVDRRADLFAAGIVLWEALTMRRLFETDDVAAAIAKVLHGTIPRPSSINGYVSQALDAVVLKALSRNPVARFQTAREFAVAIEEAAAIASTRKVSEWVAKAAAKSLAHRAEIVARIEGEPIDADFLEDQPPSAQSLRTISQAIAILEDHQASSGHLANRPERDPHTPPPTPVEARRHHEEAPTRVLATTTPEAMASPPNPEGTPALTPTSVRDGWTFLGLIGAWMSRRRLVVGGASLALALLLTLVGLAARSSPQPLATQKKSAPAIPAVVSPSVPEVKSLTEVSAESIRPSEVAAKPPEPTVKIKYARRAKTNKRAKDCDPPFFIDANGIRRIKARCL